MTGETFNLIFRTPLLPLQALPNLLGTCPGASVMSDITGLCGQSDCAEEGGKPYCVMMPDGMCQVDVTRATVLQLVTLLGSKASADAVSVQEAECAVALDASACMEIGKNFLIGCMDLHFDRLYGWPVPKYDCPIL